MPEEFHGAPTRTGRIMLAAFGAPFVVTAAVMLGVIVFGDHQAGEKLVMAIAAGVFAIAGLWLWAPAFPGVVNRVLRSRRPWITAFRPYAGPVTAGGVMVAMGTIPVLAALGVVPTDDSSWQAPRWVGGLAGGLFVVAGLYILTRPFVGRLEAHRRKQIEGLFPLLIVTGMAVIGGWVAVGPGNRDFEGGISNGIVSYGSGHANELVGRAVFGLGAMALIVILVIGWWRYLRGRW